MAVYRVGINARTGVNTANTVLFQLRAGSGGRSRINEIVWTITSAPTNATQLVIARASTVGTSSTTTAGQAVDPADSASGGTLDSAWSAAPTFSTTGPFLMATTIPATAGSIFYWSAADEMNHIVVAASAGIVFAAANASGNSTGSHSLQICWEE